MVSEPVGNCSREGDSVKQHSGDCTIYSALCNQRPIDGICTCGFAWSRMGNDGWDHMYSEERRKQMRKNQKPMTKKQKAEWREFLKRAGGAS